MSAKSYGPNENARFTLAELERMPGFRQRGDTIRCACPIHGGDNPGSFVVELTTGRGHCFARGCWGYLDDGRARGGRGPAYGAPPPIPEPPKEPEPDQQRVAFLTRCWPGVQAVYPTSLAAAYLEGRGIPLAVARRGRVGYWAEGVIAPTMRGRVVFPLATITGVPVNMMGRRLTMPGHEPKEGRWDSLPGAKGYYHPAGLRKARAEVRTLYICEGTIDALAFLAGGIETAVAICGAAGVVKREHLRGVWRVVVCLDADATGQERGTELCRLALTVGCEALRLTVGELDGAKDVAEYWQARQALPPALLDLAREEPEPLDADIAEDEARRHDAAAIAQRRDRLRVRWDDGDRSPQLRAALADWATIAAARTRLDAATS